MRPCGFGTSALEFLPDSPFLTLVPVISLHIWGVGVVCVWGGWGESILISGLPLAWIHVNAVVICSLNPLLTPKEEVITGEVRRQSQRQIREPGADVELLQPVR